jgi:cholesterol transport system auxiliary component
MNRTAWPAAGALVLALGLGGCITLFPKEKPAQLFRFDAAVQPAPESGGPPVSVRVGPIDFDAAAGADRILTVTGDEVAYVDGSRWDAPASDIFEQAIEHGFSVAGGRLHLVGPGPGIAKYRLSVQVTRFEARYVNGAAAAPIVTVHLRATLERQSDLGLVASTEFDHDVPASDNRVAPIVAAYDQATAQAVSDLVAWTDQNSR